ncbi:MAG: CbiX/SirB N-terminal domain-containing protein [Myxococcota bacterium]
MKKSVVLIGHGGIPKDFPNEKVSRLKILESQRQRAKTPMTEEESTLDHEIRTWPRTRENDPFCFGVQAIAKHLAPKLMPTKLVLAYNEFCGPSIDEAVDQLVNEGFQHITLLTTMFTPGGVHSEVEIPEIAEALQAKYSHVQIEYPWPFDLNHVAEFLAAQL